MIEPKRSYSSLPRVRTPMFTLSWTIMHSIDAHSPLFRATTESLRGEQAEIVVGLVSIDETFSQTIHTHHTYRVDERVVNRRFVDILGWTRDGRRQVNYRRLHETVTLED